MVKYSYSNNRRKSSLLKLLKKIMKIANEWKDYKILDMADGQKLENWEMSYYLGQTHKLLWKHKAFQINGKNECCI